jgi:hypothetical protein
MVRSSPYPPYPKKGELSDPHAWLDALRPNGLSPSTKSAFEAFGFDAQNPYDWARLLFILLDLHFSGPKATRQLRDARVLNRLLAMKPVPQPYKLARLLAKENKSLPKAKRWGTGTTVTRAMEKYVERLWKPNK